MCTIRHCWGEESADTLDMNVLHACRHYIDLNNSVTCLLPQVEHKSRDDGILSVMNAHFVYLNTE